MASKSPDNQTSDRGAAGASDDGVEPVAPEIGSFEWEELALHEDDSVDEPRRAQPARVKVGRTARSNRGPLMVAAVAAIATGGAVWGALLTDAVAPTGNAGVDAAERAALVALGALAGSRARRWPLFVIAALASLLAERVGLPLGLGAVAASTVLLAVDRRNRAVGAVAGAAVTLSLMQLRPVGPLGFTTLIGTVLFVSMCVSAYQRIGRAGRRRTRLTVIGAAVVIVAGLIVAGVVLIGQVNPVESAVDNTRRGAAAARPSVEAAHVAAVDGERLAGDVGRRRRAEEGDRLADLLGLAQPGRRHRGRQRRADLLGAAAGAGRGGGGDHLPQPLLPHQPGHDPHRHLVVGQTQLGPHRSPGRGQLAVEAGAQRQQVAADGDHPEPLAAPQRGECPSRVDPGHHAMTPAPGDDGGQGVVEQRVALVAGRAEPEADGQVGRAHVDGVDGHFGVLLQCAVQAAQQGVALVVVPGDVERDPVRVLVSQRGEHTLEVLDLAGLEPVAFRRVLVEVVDQQIIDGAVRGTGAAALRSGSFLSKLQNGAVRSGAFGISAGTIALLIAAIVWFAR